MSPFEYVNAINKGEDIISKSDNQEELSDAYSPYFVNKAFSYFPDTIYFANLLNQYPDLPKRAQFDFYLGAVRPKKRFSKWAKQDVSEKVMVISEYFNYTVSKAREIEKLITEENLNEMRKQLEKGGKNDRHKQSNRGKINE